MTGSAGGSIDEYLRAMKASPRFGPQVVHHREVPGREAVYARTARPWPPVMERLVAALGIGGLYRHQAAAIDHLRAGRHVLTATPTASGKSLIYNLPVFERLLADRDAHALYLFPLKALAQDQLRAVEELNAHLPTDQRLTAAIYDGDTRARERRALRENPPRILITNPDMLHLSLLGHHRQWGGLPGRISHVVLDEIHTYRGVFGSHMAWVLRRLRRLCRLHGAAPVFAMSSATIGNPAELAAALIGTQVTTVTESGAPAGRRHFVLFDPHDSPAHAASLLLEAALKRGLRTIVYTQSRKLTELVAMRTRSRLGPLADRLTAYRAGFLPGERRAIESRLAAGDLLGVVATSALELGIDIGSLEVCLLLGYPGSMMALHQRGGRVGRRRHDALVVMVAQEDALDRFFLQRPTEFFSRPVEAAVVNPGNEVIAAAHLLCAASEAPLAADDPLAVEAAGVVAELAAKGRLLMSADGGSWLPVRNYPHREVDLRGGGEGYAIRLTGSGELMGETGGKRCFTECHPGAVYLHRGRTYVVDRLDIDQRQVWARRRDVHYFTQPLVRKTTEIIEEQGRRRLPGGEVRFGRLRVTEQVTGYQRRLLRGLKVVGRYDLDLPPMVFETEGLWFVIPEEVAAAFAERQMHFMGGIHALEHAAIGLFPLLVLCDRNDIGGISIPFHPQVNAAAVFVYDGHAGGVGLSRAAFAQADELLARTRETVAACPCEVGCPGCVHSPKCGSGNRPIDKAAALEVAAALLRPGGGGGAVERTVPAPSPAPAAPPPFSLPEHYVVFDLETRRSAAEVGGWGHAERMGISVGVVYDSLADDFFVYLEDEIEGLVARLTAADLVVGFNNKRFDNRVLAAYTDEPLDALPTLDILEVVYRRLGYRLSLDRLAAHTLGVKKSANGLMALKWYRQGEIEKIIRYCTDDVRLTRDLARFGVTNGYLLFRNKGGQVVRCPFVPGETSPG